MFFLIAVFTVGIACLAITYKTLVGYGNFPSIIKFATFMLLFAAWFSPVILRILSRWGWLEGTAYAITAKFAYFLMGFAFILFILIILREIIWYALYYISRKPELSPDNIALLNRNNLLTLILALVISLYSVWEANKTPAIKEITLTDSKIKQDTKIVVASDLHIDKATPLWQIKNIVNAINSQNPEYILLIGDIIDDIPDNLNQEMAELTKLKAKKVFISFGNHEFYNAPAKWMIKFTKLGFEVLHNTGTAIGDTGIYIGGIPDANSANVNFAKVLYKTNEKQYKILMSHAPKIADTLEKGQFDLQLSGHTHGGQIFPFNFLAKEFNGYLAGMYEVNGNRLYITRGAGYWGPPMRFLAPADITVINLKAEKNG